MSRPVREKTRPPKRGRLLDNRGAVYVEFLASFFPVFISFWCLLQSAGLYAAKLVVRNSAYLGARAAAVVIPDDPKRYGGAKGVSGKRKAAIESAVRQGLAGNRSLINWMAVIKTKGGNGQEKTDFNRDEVVRVSVHVPYKCRLPIADKVVCGFLGWRYLDAEANMVVHGADYEYP